MASAYIITRTSTMTGKRTYRVRYRLGGRESKARNAGTFPTRRLAEARREYVNAALSRGEVPDLDLMAKVASRRTMTEMGEDYIASRIDLAVGSRKVYEHAVKALGPLGDIATDAVATRDVQEWVTRMIADGKAPSTIRKYLDAVRAILDHAEREPNPARSARLRLPATRAEEVQPPPYAHFLAIIRTISPRYRLHALVMEATGLRVDELLSATWGDLDVPGDRLRVAINRTKGRTKGRRWAEVPRDLMEQIEALTPAEDRDPEATIFPGTDSAIRNAMARACKFAEVPHYHPHDLRHRFISLRVQAGWPIPMVSQIAGHSKVSMTLDTYSHVLTEEPAWLLAEVRAQVSSVLRGPSVVPSAQETDALNDERPANADLSPRVGVTGLEPVTPSLSSWCSPN